MELSQATRELIRQMVEADVEYLPKQLGIDHVISGCIVVNLDPYGVGVGVTPRYIQVALRGEYYIDVFYRGGVAGIAVGTELNIFHLSEGDRYEVLGPGGAIGSISGGANPRYWLADNGGFTDFEPDNPAVITSAGVVTEYASIVAAIAAANSGEYVVIPPGTYDESITLKDGVKVVELSTGTVVINSTSDPVAVTTADGGYIKIKEIRVTYADDILIAVHGVHDTGSCTVIAELIRSENSGTGETYGVEMEGDGTLYAFAHDVQASGGTDSLGAVYSIAGITYCRANCLVENGAASYSVAADCMGGEQYVFGDCEATDDTYTIGAYMYNDAVQQTIYGNCTAITAEAGSSAFGAFCANVTEGQTIYGNCYASATDDAYGIIAIFDAIQTVHGDCTSEDATTSVGVYATGGATADIVQTVYGNCTGDIYGAQCAASVGVQTIIGGVASGGTYDLYRTAGTLQIASVSYNTYSGTITLLPESLNALQLAAVPTTELTIAGGIITKTQTYHRIDTEGDAATDDLDTINGATATGEVLIIRAENAGRAVVVKHNTGNIWFMGAADITLDNIEDHLLLIWDGTKWCSLGDGGGGGAGGAHNLLSATHTDTSPAAAARGYIIRGNSTPLWEEYDASTAGQVLIGDGSDVVSEVFVRFGAVEPIPTWPGMIWVNTA